MTAQPLARTAALKLLLRDFAAQEPPAAPALSVVAAFPAPPAPPAVDMEAAVAEAVAQAEAALRQTLGAEHERALEAEREAHEAQVERLRAAAGQEAAERIAQAFAGLEARLSAGMARAAGALLLPLIGAEAGRRASEALALAVCSALGARKGDAQAPPVLAAKGPRALWETLSARLEAAGIAAVWEEAEGFDIQARAGDEVWETRLGPFLAQAEEALR